MTASKITATTAGSWSWLLIALALLTIAIIALSNFVHFDPYINEVLALQGKGERGEAIFQANCAVCHGIQGKGDIGPSLTGVPQRRSKVSLIDQVVSGKTPPMPQFQPKPQDMADLLDYLQTL